MAAETSISSRPRYRSDASPGDNVFVTITVIFATIIILVVLGFAYQLVTGSWASITANGFDFYTKYDWNPSADTATFGALNFVYGTLVVSAIAVVVGGSISVGAAIFLAEYAPSWLRTPLSLTIELLAAVPSVIYGFWGVQFLSPITGGSVEPFLRGVFGWIPMFGGTVTNPFRKPPDYLPNLTGKDIFTAGIILAVMIMPIVTSISRDVIRTVPESQREGMLGLGATKWQMITRAVLPYGRSGIIGAIILGLGRAMGETVAMVFLIGGAQPSIGPANTIFAPGQTIAAQIAASVGEASSNTVFSALLQLGLTLFIITLIINIASRYLVLSTSKRRSKRREEPKSAAGIFWRNTLSVLGQLVFPILIIVFSPFLGVPLAAIILVIWGALKILKVFEVRAATAKKPFPRPLELISNPNKSYRYRKATNTTMTGVLIAAVLCAVIPLFSILVVVTINGLPRVFQDNFLTTDARLGTGILHAILGTLIMTGLGSVIGIPIGIMAGVYLAEYGKGRFADTVRFMAEVLQGVPSIIVGIVVFQVVRGPKLFVDQGVTGAYSAWAGAIALGIMIVPIITRNTEEILKLVPQNIREGALALGIPKWRVIITVVIPAAFSAIVTGVLLGVARIAGETAPLLYTANTSRSFPGSLGQSMPALTTEIYQATRNAGDTNTARLWGTAFVLIFIIFVLSFAIRFFTRNKLGTRLSN